MKSLQHADIIHEKVLHELKDLFKYFRMKVGDDIFMQVVQVDGKDVAGLKCADWSSHW